MSARPHRGSFHSLALVALLALLPPANATANAVPADRTAAGQSLPGLEGEPSPTEQDPGPPDEPERQEEQRRRGQQDPIDDEGPPASRVTAEPGRTILGALVSRGFAQEINGSVEIDVTSVALRWSRILGTPEERFLGALPGVGVEVVPAMLFDQDPTAWAGGFHLLYEHRFVTEGILPVLRLGAGFVYGNREVPPGETRHNFSLLAGFGVDIPLGRGTALGIEYRLHHVSNADTGPRNPGINAHTVVTGLSFYF